MMRGTCLLGLVSIMVPFMLCLANTKSTVVIKVSITSVPAR